MFSQIANSLSVVALVAANLAPLLGVFFLGWRASIILLLYWSENLIIGFYTILKMALVRMDSPRAHLAKLLDIPFFCFHFGFFCAGHGIALIALLKVGAPGDMTEIMTFHQKVWPGILLFVQMVFCALLLLPVHVIAHLWANMPRGMAWPLAALVVSHGISFVQNYLLGGEYRRMKLDNIMIQPYGRLIVLHVTILASAFFVVRFGSPLPMVVALVLLKTCLDATLHRKSHAPRA